MTGVLAIIARVYAFLLQLYPGSFRREFEEQMLLDFSDMAGDAREKGRLSFALFCLKEFVDFPVNLLRAYVTGSLVFRILRSRPVGMGLRSALGFGVAFGLTLPVLMFVSQKLYVWIDPIVAHLQTFFYDRFHIEQGFGLISWIPSGLSSLLVGLVLGVLFATLFAEPARYRHYVLAGMLGWFFYYAMYDLLTINFNFGVFLDGAQYAVFCHMLRAVSGAIFGLIFVSARSERPGSIRLLIIGIGACPLFTFLAATWLFKSFVFMTPWRFVGSTLLMAVLVASVFLLARKIDGGHRIPSTVIAGAIGYPVIIYMAYLVARLALPVGDLANQFNAAPFWQRALMFSTEQAVYGIVLGLLLGLIYGYQQKNAKPQLEGI